MSALGQKQTCAAHKPMSALPLKADMTATNAVAHDVGTRITFLFYRG